MIPATPTPIPSWTAPVGYADSLIVGQNPGRFWVTQSHGFETESGLNYQELMIVGTWQGGKFVGFSNDNFTVEAFFSDNGEWGTAHLNDRFLFEFKVLPTGEVKIFDAWVAPATAR